ncbi:hypothetical protein [Streptomyces sp. NPDC048419]|uniref:hypothetical protein n=1 Tax=Streptomyces sp. NPDC048419 TaxID=3365547 RepID=UPI0037114985
MPPRPLNSTVFSETWGALSVEGGSGLKLSAVNCHVGNTGDHGYGSIIAGPAAVVHYGDSTRAAVAALNTELDLGPSNAELKSIPARNTVVNSDHFGYMFFGTGTLTLDGGTVVNSERATFLNKGRQTAISVDGSQGARLNRATASSCR